MHACSYPSFDRSVHLFHAILMKDLSFLLFKNFLGAKMRKGVRSSFCNDDNSTSTLNQHDDNGRRYGYDDHHPFSASRSSPDHLQSENNVKRNPAPTLEEMLLQLELEEGIARKEKLYGIKGRMSCVNNSDILRSARNALNQYPRFSLDGKDAMYRSSFHNFQGRKSISCDRGVVRRDRFLEENGVGSKFERVALSMPSTLAGESVVWCKPGVVAKLMGLEALPVPVSSDKNSKERLSSILKRKNLRRRAEEHEMERRLRNQNEIRRSSRVMSSSSKFNRSGYRVVKPIKLESPDLETWRCS